MPLCLFPMLNFFRQESGSVKNDLLSGLTVALALVPEAIAFAFVAGVSPLIGLYSAFFLCLIAAVVGGRPGMISGATGAMAVVVVALVQVHGIEYLFPTVILCGLMQVLVGIGRLGKLIRMVPHPVMLGFVNGLAIVIGLAQLGSFKTLSPTGDLVFLSGSSLWMMVGLVALTMAIIWLLPKWTTAVPASLVAILTVTLLAVAINRSLPTPTGENTLATVGDMLRTNSRAAAVAKSREDAPPAKTYGELNANVDDFATTTMDQSRDVAPESARASEVTHTNRSSEAFSGDSHRAARLVSVVRPAFQPEGAALSDSLSTPATIPSPIAPASPPAAAPEMPGADDSGISGGLPVPFFMQYAMVPLNLETLRIIFPFAIVLCGVGLIESLMTLSLIDEITETRGQGNRECIGQGTANVVCGFFGGMGGCAMIGQSLINVNSGGRGRLSGITAAVCLLMFVLFLAPWIEQIPMAALVGVMFMVVIGTFEWASLKMFRRMPRSDVFVMVLVAGYTVIEHDLASAVILGVIVSALVFAWQHATHIGADVKYNEYGSKIYQLHGPLFFASVSSFKEMLTVSDDPEDVVIDFYYTRVYDQSALEAIHTMAEKYQAAGKRLHLRHLSAECQTLLDKAGDLVEINVSEDPHYHVATDRLA